MIETLIQDLIKALQANTEALNRASSEPAAKKPRKAAAEATPEPAPEAPAAEAPKTPAAPAAPATPAAPAIDLASLRATAQAILDLGGLDKIKAINAKLGIKKVSECPPEKFSDLNTALNAAKQELEKK